MKQLHSSEITQLKVQMFTWKNSILSREKQKIFKISELTEKINELKNKIV